eukprot:g3901.t1
MFFFSTVSGPEVIGRECWDDHVSFSKFWEVKHLIGDKDANYAALVAKVHPSYIPWAKVKSWLKSKKYHLETTVLPPWLSKSWLKIIPDKYVEQIWHEEEINAILLKIEESYYEKPKKQDSNSQNEKKRPSDMRLALDREKERHDIEQEKVDLDSVKKREHEANIARRKVLKRRLSSSALERVEKLRKSSVARCALQQQENHIDLARTFDSLFQKFIQQVANATSIEVMLMSEENKNLHEVIDVIMNNFKVAKNYVITWTIVGVYNFIENEDDKVEMKANTLKTFLSAITEMADEVSDTILVFLYIFDSKSQLLWAGGSMFAFILINRIMNVLVSTLMIRKQKIHEVIYTMAGCKPMIETYFLLTAEDHVDRNYYFTVRSRQITIFCGSMLESLPQMTLQLAIVISSSKSGSDISYDSGLLYAQMLCVLTSCIAIGISVATMVVEFAEAMRQRGKPKHTLPVMFYPKDNKIQASYMYISMIGWFAIHLLYIALGFTALFSSAPYVVSFSIVGANIFIFNVLRYVVQDNGWRGLDLWLVKSAKASIASVPVVCVGLFAGMVWELRRCDVPWDKVTNWLRSKKDEFLDIPPEWMSPEWLEKLPADVKNTVWSEAGSLDRYIKMLKDYDSQDTNVIKRTQTKVPRSERALKSSDAIRMIETMPKDFGGNKKKFSPSNMYRNPFKKTDSKGTKVLPIPRITDRNKGANVIK